MNDKQCQTCGGTFFEWTDSHGEVSCRQCGTPYQLLVYDESKKRIPDAPFEINMMDNYVPLLRRYWNETRKHMGLGSYWDEKYPDNKEAFYQWLGTQPDAPAEVVDFLAKQVPTFPASRP